MSFSHATCDNANGFFMIKQTLNVELTQYIQKARYIDKTYWQFISSDSDLFNEGISWFYIQEIKVFRESIIILYTQCHCGESSMCFNIHKTLLLLSVTDHFVRHLHVLGYKRVYNHHFWIYFEMHRTTGIQDFFLLFGDVCEKILEIKPFL